MTAIPRRGFPIVVLCLRAALLSGALLAATLIRPANTVASASPSQPEPRPTTGMTTYRAPVLPLRVLRGFAPPLRRYGAGHLGVDLVASGSVLAAGPGTVTFAGSVAGRGVVVLLHPDGVRTEYEPLRPVVARGQQVRAGAELGTVAGAHRGCPVSCVHWGARRGDAYLDPLTLLQPLGPVRLLPWSA